MIVITVWIPWTFRFLLLEFLGERLGQSKAIVGDHSIRSSSPSPLWLCDHCVSKCRHKIVTFPIFLARRFWIRSRVVVESVIKTVIAIVSGFLWNGSRLEWTYRAGRLQSHRGKAGSSPASWNEQSGFRDGSGVEGTLITHVVKEVVERELELGLLAGNFSRRTELEFSFETMKTGHKSLLLLSKAHFEVRFFTFDKFLIAINSLFDLNISKRTLHISWIIQIVLNASYALIYKHKTGLCFYKHICFWNRLMLSLGDLANFPSSVLFANFEVGYQIQITSMDRLEVQTWTGFCVLLQARVLAMFATFQKYLFKRFCS